ncbi:aspartyl protease family protein [Sphingomonas qomolangmaensis]|uniref:Aspartyl protease family protein n=1 Tax=Sphingomonas qomolangmaensis TaxID=2918765 RepID=A0ABY5LDA3_9SPHN|nr:aspartyl protease family protein [Sphingomonas qomolangmaensis]UUL83876.1 aspartyl protease family protein [Sphingomonas qomolangmaensis]
MHHPWLASLPLLFAASAAPAQSLPAMLPTPVAGVSLTADSEARWVDFTLTPGNQLRFTMLVNGSPAAAILDTGVSFSVASQRFVSAARLEVARAPAVRAEAIGGAVPISWVATRTLGFGGLQRSGGRFAVVDLKAVATGSAEPVEILVGSDILSCCALDIDFDASRFRLLPSGRLPFQGATAPLSVGPRSKVFISEVTIGDKTLRPLIVDTGDGSSLTLSRAAWALSGANPQAVTTAVAFGLGGQIETELAILPSARLGTQPLSNVEVRIEGKGGFSDLTRTSGRIGSGLLQRYRVLLDPRAGRMVTAPGKAVDQQPVRSTSGLLIGYDNGRLRVLHVMRGGPAAATGWRAGDQICTVDGAPIPPINAGGSVDTGWSAGTPGRTVELGLCNGTQRRLTLRQFY